jgi:para-aminobenzoate synthetase/4-amino-4-deoxychorismate lyase
LSKDIFNGSWLPRYFGFLCDVAAVREQMEGIEAGGHRPLRVRLSLTREGVVTIQAAQLPSASVLTVVLGAEVVDPDDVDVYHKTTHREQYDNAQSGARAAGGGRGDSAEPAWRIDRVCDRQSRLEHEGRRITPALTCGLLPGTFRAEMLAMGQIEEGVLRAADAIKADAIYMINSVRRWVPLQLRGVAGRVNQTTEERAPCTG